MSGRSRIRQVRVSPVRRSEPDVVLMARVLVELAVEVERLAALPPVDGVKAAAAEGADGGDGSMGRAA